MNKARYLATSIAFLCATSGAFAAHHESGHKAVAEGWDAASCGELAEFIEYVNMHMADDGVFMPARYVGLGFQINNDDDEDFATIVRVTPGTPAAKALRVGDQFVSVNGVPASFENRDKMTFRGKPGDPVKAVIKRDGKELSVDIQRGVIAATNTKEQSLANLAVASADDWAADSCKVTEIIEEGDVVYMTSEFTDTEEETGYQYTGRNVTRFKFNSDGKIAEAWTMGEGRFILEQLGYTITR
jgi:membrane-associated protease RseP (regulator of RpoE activity)